MELHGVLFNEGFDINKKRFEIKYLEHLNSIYIDKIIIFCQFQFFEVVNTSAINNPLKNENGKCINIYGGGGF